MPYYSLLR